MTRQPARWLAPLAFCASLGYVGAAAWRGVLGFPLDDAWIHQTYARNLVQTGAWAFVPGQPSAGSTSPLWTLALAAGYLLRLDYRAWTVLLGAALLALTAILARRLALRLFPDAPSAAALVGGALAVEWHLVWASVSGMETILFIALSLAVWTLALPPGEPTGGVGGRRALALGLVVGLSVLTRPDGLTLAPFALGVALFSPGRAGRVRLGALFTAGLALVVAPYLLFNYRLSGALWPNTYYAKQAEYAALRSIPYWRRLIAEMAAPLVGAQILLVPGVIAAVASCVRRRWPAKGMPLAWALLFISLYAWRLPVTYQHGRYVIPVLPVVFIYGIGGTAGWLRALGQSCVASRPPAVGRVVGRAGVLSFASLALIFLGLGARAYVEDVQIINTEMVATARWLERNTPPDALIAAHDIGALGYFSNRRLLDLAGLVSPEVIAFIRDERRLSAYLTANRADYLMTFPGWYPTLAAEPTLRRMYVSPFPFSPAAGGENMAVYALRP